MLNRLQDVFASLNRHDVRYVVIGGIAAVLHGVPRATFDLDLLIEPSPDNAERLVAALLEANLGTAALTSPREILANEITVSVNVQRAASASRGARVQESVPSSNRMSSRSTGRPAARFAAIRSALETTKKDCPS